MIQFHGRKWRVVQVDISTAKIFVKMIGGTDTRVYDFYPWDNNSEATSFTADDAKSIVEAHPLGKVIEEFYLDRQSYDELCSLHQQPEVKAAIEKYQKEQNSAATP